MIRLFASDLDGTLLNIFHRTDHTIVRAIRAVTDAGARFSIATGRFMRTNDEFGLKGLPIEAVCANGAIIFGRDGQVLRRKLIDKGFLEELLLAFPGISFDCTGTHHVYTTMPAEQRRAIQRKPRVYIRRLMYGFTGMQEAWVCGQTVKQILAHDIVKVNVSITDKALSSELGAFISEHADTVVNAPFSSIMFEITNKGIDKGEALCWLAREFGISVSEVAVYGDGGNDIAMLRRFAPYGHAYAPRGSSEDARHAASHIIGSFVFHAVPHHMLATLRSQRPK